MVNLNGKKLVFTGRLKSMRRAEAKALAEAAGATVTSSVSGQTEILVVGGENAGAKLVNAPASAIHLNEDEFLAAVKGKKKKATTSKKSSKKSKKSTKKNNTNKTAKAKTKGTNKSAKLANTKTKVTSTKPKGTPELEVELENTTTRNAFYTLSLYGTHHVCSAYGPIGKEGRMTCHKFPTKEHAMKEFRRLYFQKTHNEWDSRKDFVPVHGKYTPKD
jgi:predicted DNA-binding WGR domain protein